MTIAHIILILCRPVFPNLVGHRWKHHFKVKILSNNFICFHLRAIRNNKLTFYRIILFKNYYKISNKVLTVFDIKFEFKNDCVAKGKFKEFDYDLKIRYFLIYPKY